MRYVTTGLEIAACVSLLTGAYLLAGVGCLLVAASGVLFGLSYAITRGSR